MASESPLRPKPPAAMRRIRAIHFVGIGGVGMGGIAEVLLNLGYAVSGSDRQANALTRRLASLGATIHQDHAADHATAADVVVVSGAVAGDNPELVAARGTIGMRCARAATSSGLSPATAPETTTTSAAVAWSAAWS